MGVSVTRLEPRGGVFQDSQGWDEPEGPRGHAGDRAAFSYPSPGARPPSRPHHPAAVPGAPTSPRAEAVPYDHLLRMPIATAPAWAMTGQSPLWGLRWPDKDLHSELSGTEAHPRKPGPSTHPRSPSSVLWISFRTPGEQRPGELSRAGRDTALLPLLLMGCWVGLSRSGRRPSVPAWPSRPPPRTPLLPAPPLPPRLTLVIEQSVLHHGAGPPLWKAEARSGEPWALCPSPS